MPSDLVKAAVVLDDNVYKNLVEGASKSMEVLESLRIW